MSKKKQFFSPSQMVILTGVISEGTDDELQKAKPGLPADEEEVLILPDGSVDVVEGDVVVPNDMDENGISVDEAYY